MKPFQNPRDTLRGLEADDVARLLLGASDIALVLDADAVVRDVAVGVNDLPMDVADAWVGDAFVDTVATESRDKVSQLVEDAGTTTAQRWRHVSHPVGSGASLPMLYRSMPLAENGQTLLVGRDLRTTARLQERLIEAQQSLERDYSRLRHLETRYRLLFQIASEPILIVDATSQRVLEANPAALRCFADDVDDVATAALADLVAPRDGQVLEDLLAGVRTTGRPDEITVDRKDDRRLMVSASLFRQETASLFLLRVVPLAESAGGSPADAKIVTAIDEAPDAFVLTSADGRIMRVNNAFVDLAQLATADQAVGLTLDRWIGRSGVDLQVMFANLRERGVVKLFETELRSDHGVAIDVEISAVAVVDDAKTSFAFIIRNVGRRLQGEAVVANALPRSVDQLTELVGRVSLKEVVRETTDMIERLYVEAALELTKNNRASAAELLGLSRQSLYVKLHRYGLHDTGGDDQRDDSGS